MDKVLFYHFVVEAYKMRVVFGNFFVLPKNIQVDDESINFVIHIPYVGI